MRFILSCKVNVCPIPGNKTYNRSVFRNALTQKYGSRYNNNTEDTTHCSVGIGKEFEESIGYLKPAEKLTKINQENNSNKNSN